MKKGLKIIKITFLALLFSKSSYALPSIKLGGSAYLSGFAANHAPTTVGLINPSNHASTLILDFSDINVTAKLQENIEAYTDLIYAQQAPAFIHNQPGNGNVFFLSQSFLTLGGSMQYPYYLRAGLICLPFGGINYSSDMESFIQLLSLNGPPTLQLGLLQEQGLNGSIFVFSKYKLLHDTDSTNIHDYGTSIEYKLKSQSFGYNIGAGYVTNILSNFFISSTTANNSNLHNGMYVHRVPAIDFHALFNFNQFDGGIRIVNALTHASVNDVPFTHNYGASLQGARLAAWSINLGYHFDLWHFTTRLVGGYEGSYQAAAVGTTSGAANYTNQPALNLYNTTPSINNYAAIGLPKTRLFAFYKINTTKWTTLAFEVDDYIGYSKVNGGTGHQALMGMVQIGVKYS